MFCIKCFSNKTSVINSRPHKKRPTVWRRRQCKKCAEVFTTYERPIIDDTTPVYHTDGTSDSFHIGILMMSIARAFTHEPFRGERESYWLAQTIETTLASEHRIITTGDIQAITHYTLQQFDATAALQYAIAQQIIVDASLRRRGRPSLSLREPRTGESPSR